MKKKVDKIKIFKYLVLAYFIISPLFDLIFLYNKITTLMRVMIILLFVGLTVILFKESRKKIWYLLAYYLAIGFYLAISYFHSKGFTTLLPDLSYSVVNEATTLLKLCMPFSILFIFKYLPIEKEEFFKVIFCWVVLIAGSIVVCNLVGYSLSSYTDEITKHSIFSWGRGLPVTDIATKGFFTYANQISNVVSVLLVVMFYEVIIDKRMIGVISLVLIALSCLMLGTRLSTYGGAIILGGFVVIYLGYALLFKKKISRWILFPIILSIGWTTLLPIAPCNSRMQEIKNAKTGEQSEESMTNDREDVRTMEEVDERLVYIENNINKATIGKQFYMDYYPYMYDMNFWEDIVEKQKQGDYIDYRKMEMLIADRLFEIDDRKADIFWGISNVRMQKVTNIERDFVLHYYTLGIVGSILSLSFYIFMLVVLIKMNICEFSFWNISLLGILVIFVFGSFMTGNSLNFLATTVPFSYVVCAGKKIFVAGNRHS